MIHDKLYSHSNFCQKNVLEWENMKAENYESFTKYGTKEKNLQIWYADMMEPHMH